MERHETKKKKEKEKKKTPPFFYIIQTRSIEYGDQKSRARTEKLHGQTPQNDTQCKPTCGFPPPFLCIDFLGFLYFFFFYDSFPHNFTSKKRSVVFFAVMISL